MFRAGCWRQSDHGAEKTPGILQGSRTEENPADHDNQQQVNVTERRYPARHPPRDPNSLRDQERPVKETPEDEIPACAVPEAAKKKDDDQVRVDTPGRNSISAERNV